jgi:DNA-binding NarL/FixJ family response regulator
VSWPAWPRRAPPTDVDQFVADLGRVAGGENIVDPTPVPDLAAAPMTRSRLGRLTCREREVLAVMAEGLTDRGIATRLAVSTRTAQAHAEAIFRKLDLPVGPADNRRVHAVLTYLQR